MLSNIFIGILNMSISAGIIAVVVILLRAVLKNKMNKTLILLFWAVVFIKLALPLELPSPTSVFNVFPSKSITNSIDNFVINSEKNTQSLNKDSSKSAAGTYMDHSSATLVGTEINQKNETSNPSATPAKAIGFTDIVPVIWLCGAILLFLFFICSYITACLRFKQAIMIKNNFVSGFIKEYHLKRKVSTLTSSDVKTPVAFGVLNPKIILPVDFDVEDETVFKHILTHEMQHIIRLDNLTNLCILFLLCLHWFNPIVWLCKVLSSKDMEAACDEGAIRRLGEQSKLEYAQSLLRMAQHNRGFSPALFVAFGESKVKSRIKATLKYKNKTAASTVLAVIMLCGVCLFFATGAFSGAQAKSVVSSRINAINSTLPGSSSSKEENHGLSISSSSTAAQPYVDIFMNYVNDHGYRVQTDSEGGGPIRLIDFYNVKSTAKINEILNKAYQSSKKLGFDFLSYQNDAVDFRTCGIELKNGKYAEADCFTYQNKIIGFWIFTPSAKDDKTDYDSLIILDALLVRDNNGLSDSSVSQQQTYDLTSLNIVLPQNWHLDTTDKVRYCFVDDKGINRGWAYSDKYKDDFDFTNDAMPNHSSIINSELLDIPLGECRLYTLDTDNGTAAEGATGTHDDYYAVITVKQKVNYILEFSKNDKNPQTKEQFIEILKNIRLQ
jgi:beta-lactamase regulating signal transducer with metallopeptidase domain